MSTTPRADDRPGALRSTPTPAIAVVVLTQNTRPAELTRALDSVRRQSIPAQLILVANGSPVVGPRRPDTMLDVAENIGIPAARNLGAEAADAPLVMFLDDDAELLDPGLLAGVVSRFTADPRLGAMALRLVDEHGRTQRRHIPRIGAQSAERSGRVTHFVGAACVVRREAFRAAGGFDPRFFYAMEESDLSWRLLDAGWSIWYAADLLAYHPRTAPSRHPGYVRLTARNRLWMAWRLLPAPLLVGYLTTWTVLAALRRAPLGELLAGYRQAVRELPPRRPMSWRTAATMTRLGRPPVI